MSRGELDLEVRTRIESELPSLARVQNQAIAFAPDFISSKFPPDSPDRDVPIAAVCLGDLAHTLGEIWMATFESRAHRAWYRDVRESPSVMTSLWTENYFLDDAALRLYSGGEHLANAIVSMLGLGKPELDPFAQRHSSLQRAVGNYLLKVRPDLPHADVVRQLLRCGEWDSAIRYRNDWVHAQPPHLTGLGIVFKRQRRWRVDDEGGANLYVGQGDQPTLTVEELRRIIETAFRALVTGAEQIMDVYRAMLERAGIRFTDRGRMEIGF